MTTRTSDVEVVDDQEFALHRRKELLQEGRYHMVACGRASSTRRVTV